MKTLCDHLTQYAAFHQDRRNLATHFVGIPLIVLAVATLLARPVWSVSLVGPVSVSMALLLAIFTCLFYLRLDLRFGVVLTGIMSLAVAIGQALASQSTAVWLSSGLALFFVGWATQLLGHYYEGKKPAFVDDVIGLLVGPLFLAAEVAFYLKWRTEVEVEINRRLCHAAMRHGKSDDRAFTLG
jgi:uncharacterized membrane protein YGL010W